MKTTRKESCIEYMRQNPPQEEERGYYKRVAKEFGYTPETVRKYAESAGVKNVRANVQAKRNGESLPEAIHKFLIKSKKKDVSVEELSDHFDVGVSKVQKALDELYKAGINVRATAKGVSVSGDIPKAEPTVIKTDDLKGQEFRFGLISDNHLCSRYERMDILNAMYDLFAEQDINVVYNCGNMIDGEARFNKFDLHTYGIDGQSEYFVNNYPRRDGVVTKFITGDDHEGWYQQSLGIDIGRHIEQLAKEAGRQDLQFLGYMEHDIIYDAPNGQTILRLLHPGGGSSYAISYTPQKIVESYQGGEKPHILLIGHYHKASYNLIRGVHCIQAGCTQDQTPFMRKKRLAAHLGGWIVTFETGARGEITRFNTEFYPFYDRDFYDKKKNWKYLNRPSDRIG